MTSEHHKKTHLQGSAEIETVEGKGQPHPISEAERDKRKQAVAYATASIGLSGLATSDGMRQLGERYVSGEIDLEEFMTLSQNTPPAQGNAQPSGAQ